MTNSVVRYCHNIFRRNETQIHELNYLFWECTQRCNLNCLHCGSDCISDSRYKDMPFDDFLNAILPLKKIYDADKITVVITGGEPTLRKDLAKCGLELRKNGFRWGIVTNGFSYNEDVHGKLLAAGIGAITVSLDGFNDTHNWLRANSNSFNNVVNALRLITSSSRLNYDVVTCVHQKNLGELREFKEFLISEKIKAWRLFTIAPIGRAAVNKYMQLSALQTRELMDFIAECRSDDRIKVTFSCEAYVGKYERKVRDSLFFCRAGINIASVLIDGSISACPNINRHFVQGNIYKDRLVDVWNNKFQIMRDRQWAKTGVCSNCKEFKTCNGGAMHLWNEKRDCIMSCTNRKLKQSFKISS